MEHTNYKFLIIEYALSIPFSFLFPTVNIFFSNILKNAPNPHSSASLLVQRQFLVRLKVFNVFQPVVLLHPPKKRR